ncbi:MAG: hypothetical protein A3K22_03505 [Deltaproteobacteria bacterium RBG_16_42_7]|nr:MAG: hypothetical protein A3K22_03505 [Deltaproteobacteria bacterium RBG_16_42_7]
MAIETVGMIITAVAAAGGAYYSYESGQQQKKAYKANAAILEQDALAEKQKAEYEEGAHRNRIRQILSRQKALYGKSGVQMEGSPLLVMEDTAAQGEMDALAIRYGGDVAAARTRSEANLMRMQGRTAGRLGTIKAGTTLLQGAGQSYRTYRGTTVGTIQAQGLNKP